MASLKQYWQLLTHLGPGWMAYRALYAWRGKSGVLSRATPMMPWDNVPLSRLALHYRTAPPEAKKSDLSATIDQAEMILAGQFRLFSYHHVQSGVPPDWQTDQLKKSGDLKPETGHLKTNGAREHGAEGGVREANRATPISGFSSQVSGVNPSDSQPLRHWTDISDSGAKDIKGVWELSRFPWAYVLARAYAATQDSRYQDAFWALFSDWCDRNPPNTGSNWMCGQESTFRLMAVLFAVEAMGLRQGEEERLTLFVVATGQRIAANLDYALSQKNNHGISECVGLITVALTVPDHQESPSWLSRGQRHLERQLDELVYQDGSFSQHSLIYHRVLIHDLVWVISRLRLAQQEVPVCLEDAAGRALDFLIVITDPETGEAPLFGSNDGANILPLAEADYLDMRPTIQMASALFREELPLPLGRWDEAAEWMAGPVSEMRRVKWAQWSALWLAKEGGYGQLALGRDRIFIRCPERFIHRPSQADMLHVDVWLDGKAVTRDGGSFSYNSSERFKDLSKACHHNVLTVDGIEPLKKFSRFLYLPWPKGGSEELRDKSQVLGAAERFGIRATHDGYQKLGVSWSREVSVNPGSGFVIKDRVETSVQRHLRWHWHLAGDGWTLDEEAGECRRRDDGVRIAWTGLIGLTARLIQGDANTAMGWWSPYYSVVEPCYSLVLESKVASSVELITEFTQTRS